MIGTTKKPFEEILQALEGYEKIAVVGCDGCAKVCATGGLDQVKELAQDLKGKGKKITLEVSPERTCNIMKSRESLSPCKDQIAAADAVHSSGVWRRRAELPARPRRNSASPFRSKSASTPWVIWIWWFPAPWPWNNARSAACASLMRPAASAR